MVRRRILLIGPMPPPSGGVSVHLQRLLKRSANEAKLVTAVFDPRKSRLFLNDGSTRNLFSAIIYFLRSGVVHIHLADPRKFHLAILCKFFGKKVIYTIHNPRDLYSANTKKMTGISDKTIFVFDPGTLPANGVVLPAYIPAEDDRSLPVVIEDVINRFSRLIVTISSSSGKEENEKDIYGFDLILEAFEKINLQGEYALIMIDTTGKMEERYRNRVLEVERESKNKICYFTGDLNFQKLLKHCQVFIRATRSDGDSLSVREALNEGVAVLASDCCKRPPGCHLFFTGDAIDLSNQLMNSLSQPISRRFRQDDHAAKLFEIYLHI